MIKLGFVLACLFGMIYGKMCFDVGNMNDETLSFTSENGYLNINGTRFNMKGLSWFGFETSVNVFQGLWVHDYHWYIDFMTNYSFNAIRIPFSCEMVINNPIPSSINTYQMNEDLVNKTALECLDIFVEAFADAGIVIMLDMHSLENDGYMQDGLWYNDKYPQTTTLNVWKTMFNRYKDSWNVFAIDVFNEPFDGTWGTGNQNTDFNSWCQTVGNTMFSMGLEWLVLCEGVADSPSCSDPCFWGEDLQGVSSHPVGLTRPNKIVYSPHCYGPSVDAQQPYFNSPDFPNNMPSIWDVHYGFIRKINGPATVVGEWGGQMSGKDQQWMDAYANYLISQDIPDQFFWCLNSNSGDTGGLLDGWNTPDTARLDLVAKVQPNPTKIVSTSNHVCFDV